MEPDGGISINNPNAIAAIKEAISWIGTITPTDVLNYAEEEIRSIFQSGNAVFMRNWPYAWVLAQGPDSPIKDKVGVSALPKGGDDGRHGVALYGRQLAVSKYSQNQEGAIGLIMSLVNEEEQKRRALAGSYLPTVKSLYSDEEVLTALPFISKLYDVFVDAVPHPSTVAGAKYNQVSTEFFTAVHSALTGSKSAEQALAQLENRLQRRIPGEHW